VKSKSLDVDPEPEAYLLYWQKAVVESTRGISVVVRTTAPIDAVASLLRTAVAELDRDQPIGPIRPMDDLVAESLAPARLNLWLLVAFAVVVLVLTAEGLYGVMAYLVTQRAHEIGILGPGSILGHSIFIDTHSWVRWHTDRDVAILAETGTAVAHFPARIRQKWTARRATWRDTLRRILWRRAWRAKRKCSWPTRSGWPSRFR